MDRAIPSRRHINMQIIPVGIDHIIAVTVDVAASATSMATLSNWGSPVA